MSTDVKLRRCAVYTRKSSEEGLEQDFNSLQAQRESCEAFIASQRHEGWKLIPTAYDDGGISGGTMARPALQRLLSDIRSGKVDVIVVYKVDRMTRALADFAKMVEIFDAHGASFVAVTQQFNTTTSMGRLTLNVLLSFAQFEREVTGERIRDKIAASKAKGIWMGGGLPRGYRVENRKLIIVPEDAEVVRAVYCLYQSSSSIRDLSITLRKQGIRARSSDGKLGGWMSRGALYALLKNPIYAGLIAHKDKLYPGQHEAIIDRETWEAAQKKLKASAKCGGRPNRKTERSPLMGKLFDERGRPLTPSHANKQGRRYRYYESHSDDRDQDAFQGIRRSGWRLRAPDIEEQSRQIVRRMLEAQAEIAQAAMAVGLTPEEVNATLRQLPTDEADFLIWIQRVQLFSDRIKLTMALPARVPIVMNSETPMTLRRRGVEQRIVIPGQADKNFAPDAQMVQAVGRGLRYWTALNTDAECNAAGFARAEGVHSSDLSRFLPLAFLTPDIVEAIASGRQPVNWTAKKLQRLDALPLSWAEQRRILEFA
jgi:DNA invertase Pin-like site-specific DNA recombinase